MSKKKDFVTREEFEEHENKSFNWLSFVLLIGFFASVAFTYGYVRDFSPNQLQGKDLYCAVNETIHKPICIHPSNLTGFCGGSWSDYALESYTTNRCLKGYWRDAP